MSSFSVYLFYLLIGLVIVLYLVLHENYTRWAYVSVRGVVLVAAVEYFFTGNKGWVHYILEFFGFKPIQTDVLGVLFWVLFLLVFVLQEVVRVTQREERGLHGLSYTVLLISIFFLLLADRFVDFMLFWECMSLFSFLLLLTQDSAYRYIVAQLRYMVYMHLGFFALAGGLYWIMVVYKIDCFSGLGRLAGASGAWMPLSMVFFGFATKAGLVPMHAWVPATYRSLGMRAVVVFTGLLSKLGIYGMLRISTVPFDSVYSVSLFLVVLAVFSGIYAVAQGAMQRSIKAALAYSSIENMSVVLLGLGLALLGNAVGNNSLMLLGYAAALLHTLNHALYKPLLFLSAVEVEQMYGTENVEALGGVIKTMPWVGIFFAIGAVGIVGLPPLNGFFSEYMLYLAAIGELKSGNVTVDIFMLLVLLGLGLMGGISLFMYTKILGIGFLGKSRRTTNTIGVEQHSTDVRVLGVQLFLVVAMLLVVGLYPQLVLYFQNNMLYLMPHTSIMGTAPVADTAPPKLVFTVLLIPILAMIIYWIRRVQIQKNGSRSAEIWGCGYASISSKMQYTGSGFSESLEHLLRPLVYVRQIHKHWDGHNFFPTKQAFMVTIKDKIESQGINKYLYRLTSFLKDLAVVQTGDSQKYVFHALGYIVLIALLTMLGII